MQVEEVRPKLPLEVSGQDQMRRRKEGPEDAILELRGEGAPSSALRRRRPWDSVGVPAFPPDPEKNLKVARTTVFTSLLIRPLDRRGLTGFRRPLRQASDPRERGSGSSLRLSPQLPFAMTGIFWRETGIDGCDCKITKAIFS